MQKATPIARCTTGLQIKQVTACTKITNKSTGQKTYSYNCNMTKQVQKLLSNLEVI